MKLNDIMTNPVVRIDPEESVEVASRMLDRNNIGAMPVCSVGGNLCGMITDRDIVIRCLAVGKNAADTKVKDVMTRKVYVGRPDMDVSVAADLMGREQIRRLPVMKEGKLCGMVSLGDLAGEGCADIQAADALKAISSCVSER